MEKKAFPSELQARFLVRLPDGMRDQIAESAKTNNRSMNAEIVLRLQSSFANPQNDYGLLPGMTEDDMTALIATQVDKLADKLARSLHKQGLVLSPEGVALLNDEEEQKQITFQKQRPRRQRVKPKPGLDQEQP